MTAEEYLQRFDDDGYGSGLEERCKYATRQVFSMSQEDRLVKYIKKCSNMNYGLTFEQIKVLVYDYAKMLPNCNYPQSWNSKKKADTDWQYSFMIRNSTLALRKPESTSLARGLGFSKVKVEEFFTNYKNVLERYQFTPDRIFNLDETGVTTVLRPPRVVAPKGKKQIGLIASAERGELVTCVGVISATGNALPPVYIFPRVRNIDDYLENGPALSAAFGNKSGWMTGDLFIKTLEHIVKHTSCNKENKILLLMDNHESHTTLAAILYARENGIVLLSFPPHTSHKLQPLDVGVYGPFKGKCAVSLNDWMSNNPGKTVSVKHIARITKKPYLEAFTPSNITNAFEKTGIWPHNSSPFNDEDFDATLVYNDHGQQSKTERVSEEQLNRESEEPNLYGDTNMSNKIAEKDFRNQPSTSKEAVILPVPVQDGEQTKLSKPYILSPEAVRPLPKVKKEIKTVGRRPKANQGKSRIYTETPEKIRLEEIEEIKMEKQKQKSDRQKRKLKRSSKNIESPSCSDFVKIKKIKQVKRKVLLDSSSSESSNSDFECSSDSDVNLSFGSLQEDDNIEISSFILVKFVSQGSALHYIGCVQSTVSENSYQVKYLRRRDLYQEAVTAAAAAPRSPLPASSIVGRIRPPAAPYDAGIALPPPGAGTPLPPSHVCTPLPPAAAHARTWCRL
ncbi:uncharacterized protein LOC108904856 [Anoplophora glabripennis]|uniref:uncharacterized protein LOC108904856 n=1 Tax=Anoplophora glabripennis TaxID=217634 RepID=UPI000C77BC1E|nr:uncharacterized protein LOC108904856 [Anoplophora glabripennis]